MSRFPCDQRHTRVTITAPINCPVSVRCEACGADLMETMRQPTPRPFEETNPNLSLVTRFARIAGVHWSVSGTSPPEYRFDEFPGSRVRWTIASEEEASKWLDSPEALDAAAIVAVRKGVGLKIGRATNLGPIPDFAVTVFTGAGSGRTDMSMSAGRAAVLACVNAFEAKS